MRILFLLKSRRYSSKTCHDFFIAYNLCATITKSLENTVVGAKRSSYYTICTTTTSVTLNVSKIDVEAN